MRHEGKTVIVTGAAGAIGFATCEILAREGAKVMLVDIAADRLDQCTARLLDAGHDVIAHVADCADDAAVEGYARAAMAAWAASMGSSTTPASKATSPPPTSTTSRCSTRCCT